MNIGAWFTDPANWTGSGGIPAQIGYHLLYSAVALLIAMAIAVPLGIVIGYTGRGEALVAGFANALRALPSLGLLVLLFLIISPVATGKLVYVLPTVIVLVLLAVPPILTGTYAGIQNADADAVGAARGMGFTKRQILMRVAILVAVLAIVLEFAFAWLGRIIVSPGLRRVASKDSSPLATAVLEPATT